MCIVDCVGDEGSELTFKRLTVRTERFRGLANFMAQRLLLSPELILIQTKTVETAMVVVDLLCKSFDVPLAVQTDFSAGWGHAELLRAGAAKLIALSADDDIVSAELEALLLLRTPASAAAPRAAVFHKGDISLDVTRRFVTIGNRPKILLTQRESQLFSLLFKHANQVVTLETICQHVWGYDNGDVRLIRNVVFNLRKKVEENPKQPTYIMNEHGLGYVLRI